MQDQELKRVEASHIFGSYVMNTTGNMSSDFGRSGILNRDEATIQLFEMIEDYIEQA